MQIEQTNGTDTATFERREFTYEVSSETDAEVNITPLIITGQGDYRREYRPSPSRISWRDWLILGAVIVGVALLVLWIGG